MSAKNKKPAKKPAKKPVKTAAKRPSRVGSRKPVKKPKPKKPAPLRKTSLAKKPDSKVGVSYLFTPQGVVVNFPWVENGQTRFRTKTVAADTPEYDAIREAVRANNMTKLVQAVTKPERIVARNIKLFREKDVELVGGSLFIDGRQIPPDLSARIVRYAEEKLPYDSLVRFWRKLVKNPSYRAVTGLFRFLDANHFSITDEGNFIAYKGVKADWKDCHSGTMDNSIGQTVSMQRNMVAEDPNVACAAGLHVASYQYAHKNFDRGQGHTVMVAVDPVDVVAVPYADSNEKMRVCKYVVLAEASCQLPHLVVEENNLPSDNLNDNGNDNIDVTFDNNNDNVDSSVDDDDEDDDNVDDGAWVP